VAIELKCDGTRVPSGSLKATQACTGELAGGSSPVLLVVVQEPAGAVPVPDVQTVKRIDTAPIVDCCETVGLA
jgi:hypothetical protein